MPVTLLIIEDEPEFADYLRRGLTYDGYHIRLVHSAEAGLEEARRSQPDLVIFDVMLPGMDGFSACSSLREMGFRQPVLLLTARDAVQDRVTGLNAGADDYLVKPFEFDELLARLRALLRRSGNKSSIVTFADIELDVKGYVVTRQGITIRLTRTEYTLLSFLLAHPEQILTREVLLNVVWSITSEQNSNILDIYISRLRQKLGEPVILHTVFGVGYILKR